MNLKDNLEIELNDDGFAIYVNEENIKTGAKHKLWIIDGSEVMIDGEIYLSDIEGRQYKSIYNKKNNSIQIIKNY